MASGVEQKQEEIWRIERVRKYAEGHKKYAGLMYRGIVKSVRDLNISRTGRFLEMGAGPGFLSVMMAQEYPGITITAVDLSPEMADVAREYILESKLEDRIRYLVGDVGDCEFIRGLGQFNFVCSAFSLHHWKEPEDSIRNLWDAVGENGVLYIHDFKRLGLWRFLPLKGGGIDSMKAALSPDEVKEIFQKIGIPDFRIKMVFPLLIQSVTARKKMADSV
jgi:2-polyprenyl-3-methyl-5-hydroxy-6-metoxy-1,4-benzoquinol methylase